MSSLRVRRGPALLVEGNVEQRGVWFVGIGLLIDAGEGDLKRG
jgi:hypothetical protein